MYCIFIGLISLQVGHNGLRNLVAQVAKLGPRFYVGTTCNFVAHLLHTCASCLLEAAAGGPKSWLKQATRSDNTWPTFDMSPPKLQALLDARCAPARAVHVGGLSNRR